MKQEIKSDKINVRITPSLKKRFEGAAASQGHTVSDALIMLISRYCEDADKGRGGKR